MNKSVTDRLLKWYDPDIRELPWKATRDPYRIWLSEIILQQTRVQQGKPYYLRFVKHFPDVFTLANAERDEILKLWEGLGYYSRARNLHTAAKQVVEEFNGIFPTDYRSLLSLKGVGEYTAAAIASFAYDEAVAVVDGNVFRFLSRLFGIADPVDSSAGKKIFKEAASGILNKADPASHNQAIMDFGALVCLPRNPQCGACPFAADCVAFNEDRIQLLPNKSGTSSKRSRSFTFYILMDGERIIIEQRRGKDIWQGLYQFPLVEEHMIASGIEAGTKTMEEEQLWQNEMTDLATASLESALDITTYQWYKQVLSHQRIKARFVVAEFEDVREIPLKHEWKVIQGSQLKSYAYPRIIHRFLDENGDRLLNSHTL